MEFNQDSFNKAIKEYKTTKWRSVFEQVVKAYLKFENQETTIPDEEKRYCKGCLADVTDHMYCFCGEKPLKKEHTYNDTDLAEKPAKDSAIIFAKWFREYWQPIGSNENGDIYLYLENGKTIRTIDEIYDDWVLGNTE